MKSPFPGMDPFIEGCGLWEDFHHSLIEEIKTSLGRILPARYLVRTGERGYVVLANEDKATKSVFKPDVTVTDLLGSASSGEAVAVAEPTTEADELTMRAFVEEEFRETFVEIYEDGPYARLVTCIEVLSPSNKRSNTPGWDQYLRKRQGLLQGQTANLIEIDLLRNGTRMPMLDPWPNSPYVFLIARRNRMPFCKVRTAYSRKPLPLLPVPLLKPDPDATLEMQPMIDSIYARSRYDCSIDYTKLLTPPLNAEDAAWLDHQLRTRAASE